MASWTNESRAGNVITLTEGSPMGLLLALTYAATQSIGNTTTWTNGSKNSASFTNQSRSTSAWTNLTKN